MALDPAVVKQVFVDDVELDGPVACSASKKPTSLLERGTHRFMEIYGFVKTPTNVLHRPRTPFRSNWCFVGRDVGTRAPAIS